MADELVARRAGWTELDPLVAYELLRLRCEVFVVEQHCAYPDVDGRDVEPTARHHWLAPADDPAAVRAYLRVLEDTQGVLRIGRVVTASAERGRGLSQRLVAEVVAERGQDHEIVLDAQAHIAHVYARHGFVACGPDVLEDGIPHTPMRRPPG